MNDKNGTVRNVALGYVRISSSSFVVDDKMSDDPASDSRSSESDLVDDKTSDAFVLDSHSPKRQWSNILAKCEEKGWTVEKYEDIGGHRSGTSRKNRPAWVALERRLADDDVVALVANDLSRLHRKNWELGRLIEWLESYNVELVTASPTSKGIDTSTPEGRFRIGILGLVDEYQAGNTAERVKDSIMYRKSRGISNGKAPFGTVRDKNQYLIPSPRGAWLDSETGRYTDGVESDASPSPNSVWFSYYESVKRILELYSQNNIGLDKLSYQINDEGWMFRSRDGSPRKFKQSDIRRIVANWIEYGGLVVGKSAKDRSGKTQPDVDSLNFNPDRVVFPIDLLKQVGQVRHTRALKANNTGVRRKTRHYPLGDGLIYCWHCELLANNSGDINYRSSFGAQFGKNDPRYRHNQGIKCGCKNRSVRTSVIEKDFRKLIGLLQVDPQYLEMMNNIAVSLQNIDSEDEGELERKKQTVIAKCRRRIANAKTLFLEDDISEKEYYARKESNGREIAQWEARTTETSQIMIELVTCANALDKLAETWSKGTNEEKKELVQSIFTHLVYDLDSRQIKEFGLQTWIERFVTVRGKLYEDFELKKIQADKGLYTGLPHRRIELLFLP